MRRRRGRRPGLGRAAWQRTRLAVLQRDGWRCTRCSSSHLLECHHLDSTGGDNPANLTTLCASCHLDHHGRQRSPQPPGSAEWDALVDDLRHQNPCKTRQ